MCEGDVFCGRDFCVVAVVEGEKGGRGRDVSVSVSVSQCRCWSVSVSVSVSISNTSGGAACVRAGSISGIIA